MVSLSFCTVLIIEMSSDCCSGDGRKDDVNGFWCARSATRSSCLPAPPRLDYDYGGLGQLGQLWENLFAHSDAAEGNMPLCTITP